ncbi:hypothetical protein [Streptomyces sp. NPDC093589]|uniref:hypothetical protein n=1 Tax=Streptomyces sp. NPDC093589 TaxID=3366043 RepID=UPI003800592A
MIAVGISVAGLAFILTGLLGSDRGLLEKYQMHGLFSLGNVIQMVSSAVGHLPTFVTALDAAAAAYFGWAWWTGGGGDDAKRRLRSALKAFAPVRRTAPQGAS